MPPPPGPASRGYLAALARQVTDLCDEANLWRPPIEDVKRDLQFTNSYKRTFERIRDGEFLHGVGEDGASQAPPLASRVPASSLPSPAVSNSPPDRPLAAAASPAQQRDQVPQNAIYLSDSDSDIELPDAPPLPGPFSGEATPISKTAFASVERSTRKTGPTIAIAERLPAQSNAKSPGASRPGTPPLFRPDPRDLSSSPKQDHGNHLEVLASPVKRKRAQNATPAKPKGNVIVVNLSESEDDLQPVAQRPRVTAASTASHTVSRETSVRPLPSAFTSQGPSRQISARPTTAGLSRPQAPASICAISLSDDSSDELPDLNLSQLSASAQEASAKATPNSKARAVEVIDHQDSPGLRTLFAKYQRRSSESGDESDSTVRRAERRKEKGKGKAALVSAPSTARKRRKTSSVADGGNSGSEGSVMRPKTTSRLTDDQIAARAAIKERREQEKAAKEAAKVAKEAERAEKVAARDAELARKQEAADLASINKLTNKLTADKSEIAKTMIVDVAHTFSAPTPGAKTGTPSLGDSINRILTALGATVTLDWHPMAVEPEAGWKMIKWRRQTDRQWDPDLGHFVRLPHGGTEIQHERHVLVHLTATEFVAAVFPDDEAVGLPEMVGLAKSVVPTGDDVTVVFLIEGLAKYIASVKSHQARLHQDRILQDVQGLAPPRRRALAGKVVSEDEAEDALLELQVDFGCLVHETENAQQSAEAVQQLTIDIGAIPSMKRREHRDMAFYGGDNARATGADAADTFVKMLEHVHLCTEEVAKNIATSYPNVHGLVQAFRELGPECLKDIERDNGRRIGDKMSRRIAAVFLSRDPRLVMEEV